MIKWLWRMWRRGGLAAMRAGIYARTPAIVTDVGRKRQDLERLMVLAGLAPDDRLWNVVLSYADEHERNETEQALLPNLVDDARQYNAGRAASARDFASALRELRVQAEIAARKMKGEE